MNNTKIGTVNLTNVKGAIISALLMGVLALLTNIIATGNIFATDWNVVINAGILAFFTGLVSLIKNLLTDSAGAFLGAVEVK